MSKKDNLKATGAASRRDFIRNGSLAAAGFFIVPRHVLGRGYIAPSDKLNIASIGVGGKGTSDIAEFAKGGRANIVALCDVDDRQAVTSRTNFPLAKYYKDYREMLEKEKKNIDAVSVSTPDHTHFAPTMAAMQLGKHVYVQKPLTHTIWEARQLTEAAKRYKVVTQMGNQGASGEGVRQLQEWYDSGIIGEAHTVRCWTNRPVWPQGFGKPKSGADEIPKELDWDLWLGPIQYEEYHKEFVPFNWRGFWSFGTGALGDMGCHIIDPVFKVLGLGYPSEVECSVGDVYEKMWSPSWYPESCPISSSIKMKFPTKNGKHINLTWMDGGIRPERPEELGADEQMGDEGGGAIIEGSKGKMMCSTYGANAKLLPTSKSEGLSFPKKLARVPEGHYQQWVNACIAGYGKNKVSSPFDYAGPLTETILMGNLALRSWTYKDANNKFTGRKKLLWDAKNMKITNFDPANEFVTKKYREGWM